VPPRLRAADKVTRDAAVVRDRAAGYRIATIAGKHNIGERHVRQILGEHRERQLPTDYGDIVAVALETVEQIEFVIEEFADLAVTARHEGVRLGAARAKLHALSERWSLLSALGLLPNDLGEVADRIDMRLLADTLASFLREQRIADHDIHRLINQLDGRPRAALGG
jgi:hypothetical protein